MRILFLISSLSGFKRSNHLLFHNAFLRRGWQVHIGRINSLASERGVVHAEISVPGRPIEVGDSFESSAEYAPITEYDLIWVMNQPHRNLASDAYQLLWIAAQTIPFVNTVESMVFLNNKNTLDVVLPPEAVIETYSSSDANRLETIVTGDPGTWVVKPPNDGNGTNVFILRVGDTNQPVLIQSMTGSETAQSEIHGAAMLGIVRRHALLQRYVDEASESIKRVVIAGGRPVTDGRVTAAYQTIMSATDHRSNRVHTPHKASAALTSDEAMLCEKLGKALLRRGIRFTAIDMAYPYIFEINVVNPGGLQVVDRVYGVDLTSAAVEQILSSFPGGFEGRSSSSLPAFVSS